MFSLALFLVSAAVTNVIATPVERRTAVCPSVNKINAKLVDASTDNQFVSCTYSSESNPCTYFTDGTFSSGSSNCPSSIGDSSSQSSSSSAVVCLGFDNNNAQLTSSSLSQDSQILTCTYNDAEVCTYEFADGEFDSGSSVCPQSIAPDSNSGSLPPIGLPIGFPPIGGAKTTSSSSSNVVCLGFDNNNAPLISSSLSKDSQILTCTYLDEEVCMYDFADGNFDSGSSVCPQSITPDSNSGSFPPIGLPPIGGAKTSSSSSSNVVCLGFDNNNAQLLSSSLSKDGQILTCTYIDSEVCTYDFADGNFNSGSSVCPQSITPDSNSGSLPPIGGAFNGANAAAGSFLADNDSSSAKSNDTTIPKPILIALLAMNGVLVLAVLAIGCVWIFGRRSGSARLRPLSAGSGYKTVESVSVPLTNGDERHYYDAPKR